MQSTGQPAPPFVQRTPQQEMERVSDRSAELRLNRAQRARSGDAIGTDKNASTDGIKDRLKREIFEIEHRHDLTVEEKITRITHITCATCAGVAIQPIPFADIFILTPIQAYMGTRIAAIRGVPVSESEASDIVKEIIGAIGMGMIAQQLALGLYKTILPGLAGFTTIPLVYGLSYAIMKVMDAYFVAKASNRRLSATEIKALWGKAKSEGERQGKAQERNIK
jgi:uncharacterized protein (DUF697 family)